jgi:hypothetical protein
MAFLFMFWLGCAIALVLKLTWPRPPQKPVVVLDPKPPTYLEANPVTEEKSSRFELIERSKP